MTHARRTDQIVTIAEDLVALHSSDPATVHLSALVRMEHPSVATVEQALYDERSLVRHHAMRRTLWVMSRPMARLAHGAATAKVARAENARTVAALADSTDIADPERWLNDATREIVDLLNAKGPLSTRAIGRELPHLAIPVRFGSRTKNPATLNAHTKVLQGAGFDATLIRIRPTGTWISSDYRWSPTEAWLGEPIAGLDEVDAATELLELWLRRFGPATETDIRWWFGWTAGVTRKALTACDATPITLSTGDGFVASGDEEPAVDPGPWVRLLPGLDPTAMGWKERDWYIAPELVPRLFDRFGNAGPTVWVDGEIVGGWIQRGDGEIAIELHSALGRDHRALLDHAIEELTGAVGTVVVRPRFPAPAQKDLFTH